MKCKYCYQKIEAVNNRCSICTIEINKNIKNLSAKERQILYKARGIHLIAFTHLLIALLLPFLFFKAEDFNITESIIISAINIIIWRLLSRFSLIGYRIAIGYYFVYGMVSVVTIQKSHFGEQGIGILLCFLGMYGIGNNISKGLFTRSLIPS